MKRKKLSIFILSAAIVTSSVSYGMAAKADEVKETKGYNYNVNLSEQKGVANNKISVKKVNGEILGYANPFTMLQILNVNGKTVEVITQSGLRGYVDADEFTLVESAVNDKLIEKNIEGHVINVSTALNLRKEPRIGAEIIDRLLNNTKVNILGKQGSWYKIELNGQKGYVYGMFLNEGTKKENSSKAISNKKSEVKSEGKKEKKSSVKTAVKKEAKKEVVSGAKAKVAQKKREEAKANITSEVKPVINKEVKSNNKVEVKSEVNKETNNEVKTEMNLAPKAEAKVVSTSEVVQAVNPEVKSEKNLETNLQVRLEIKSEEKNEMVSKENLNVIQEAKKEEISEEIKTEINTEVESKPEMNKEVKVEEVKSVEVSEEKVEAKEEPVKVEEKVEEKVELKKDPKQEEVQDPKAKEMDELLKSEEYKFLRMSISYGGRLVDRNDIYTKDSLKILRTELEKAKKVFQDKDNLTMKLVQDTRDDLERAIVDLVKLSDVKKPVKSKAKVEAKKESNTEKKQEVKEQPAKAEVIVPEVKENKEIKKEEPVKAKEEVKKDIAKEKKSREEEIEEILKSEEYRFLLKDIAYGERLSEKITVYTRDSLKVLNAAIEKAGRIVRQKEKLTVKLVQDTRDDVDRAIVDLVKKYN
ncbi:SH3 domain-containing protein [Clostridium perfringens]